MFTDLKEKYTAVRGRQIISLFDDQRAGEFSVQADGLFFDYSKTNIDHETRDMLLALLGKVDLPEKRAAMFSGEKINITEDRAVLHTALRRTSGPVFVEGCDVMEQVLTTRARMLDFAEAVRSGAVQGQGGAYTDVVNIGIGGSDLGPAMACLALKPYARGPRCHFVSNVDGAHVTDVLANLDPRTTLVIVASKTFTTIETLTNAQTALSWMAETVERPADQFVALSTAEDKTSAFGIAADRVFGFRRLGWWTLFSLGANWSEPRHRHWRGALPGVFKRRRGDGQAFPDRSSTRQFAHHAGLGGGVARPGGPICHPGCLAL